MELTSDNVVNAAGLYAAQVSNLLLPKERHYQGYFAKEIIYFICQQHR